MVKFKIQFKYSIFILLFFKQSYSAQVRVVKPKQAPKLTYVQKNVLLQFKQVHFQELLDMIFAKNNQDARDAKDKRSCDKKIEYSRDLEGIRSKCSDSNHHVFSEIIDEWLSRNVATKIDSLNMCGCNIFAFNDEQINWDIFPGVNYRWSEQEKQQYCIEYIINNSNGVASTRMKNLRREFQKIRNLCVNSEHKIFNPIIRDYLGQFKQRSEHCICKFLANNKTQSVQYVAEMDFENFKEKEAGCSCIVM